MTTSRVSIDEPGRARAQTHVLAFHHGEDPAKGASDLLVSGYYFDRLELRANQWLIVDRYMGYHLAREDPVHGELSYALAPSSPAPQGFPL